MEASQHAQRLSTGGWIMLCVLSRLRRDVKSSLSLASDPVPIRGPSPTVRTEETTANAWGAAFFPSLSPGHYLLLQTWSCYDHVIRQLLDLQVLSLCLPNGNLRRPDSEVRETNTLWLSNNIVK